MRTYNNNTVIDKLKIDFRPMRRRHVRAEKLKLLFIGKEKKKKKRMYV